MTFWCRDSLPLPRSEQCKWSEVRRTWVFVGCLKGEVPTKMRWRKGDDLKIWRYIWDILGIKMSYLTTMYCSIYETFDSGLFLPKIHVKRFASIHPKVPFQCTVYQSHDWLVASPHLKNISQNGNLPQIGVNIKNIFSILHLTSPAESSAAWATPHRKKGPFSPLRSEWATDQVPDQLQEQESWVDFSTKSQLFLTYPYSTEPKCIQWSIATSQTLDDKPMQFRQPVHDHEWTAVPPFSTILNVSETDRSQGCNPRDGRDRSTLCPLRWSPDVSSSIASLKEVVQTISTALCWYRQPPSSTIQETVPVWKWTVCWKALEWPWCCKHLPTSRQTSVDEHLSPVFQEPELLRCPNFARTRSSWSCAHEPHCQLVERSRLSVNGSSISPKKLDLVVDWLHPQPRPPHDCLCRPKLLSQNLPVQCPGELEPFQLRTVWNQCHPLPQATDSTDRSANDVEEVVVYPEPAVGTLQQHSGNQTTLGTPDQFCDVHIQLTPPRQRVQLCELFV